MRERKFLYFKKEEHVNGKKQKQVSKRKNIHMKNVLLGLHLKKIEKERNEILMEKVRDKKKSDEKKERERVGDEKKEQKT